MKCQKTQISAYYNCINWNVRKLISSQFQCTSITKFFLSLLDHFTAYYNSMSDISEHSYLSDFSAQISQIVLSASLTVLRLITTVWPEMTENTYLRDFSAQVSQIFFLPYLTVLRLITTVWHEMSENS